MKRRYPENIMEDMKVAVISSVDENNHPHARPAYRRS